MMTDTPTDLHVVESPAPVGLSDAEIDAARELLPLAAETPAPEAMWQWLRQIAESKPDEMRARVAELERQTDDRAYRIETLERERNVIAKDLHMVRRERDTAWNDAIREAMKACHSAAYDGQYPQDDNIELGCLRSRDYIRALLRNEGGSDDQ